ncbi:hypothetical protein Tco_0445917 [Tanacetum coccineum]
MHPTFKQVDKGCNKSFMDKLKDLKSKNSMQWNASPKAPQEGVLPKKTKDLHLKSRAAKASSINIDKYVAEILKKFDFVSVKTASTPIETQKPLVKDEEASDVDVHLYRS